MFSAYLNLFFGLVLIAVGLFIVGAGFAQQSLTAIGIGAAVLFVAGFIRFKAHHTVRVR